MTTLKRFQMYSCIQKQQIVYENYPLKYKERQKFRFHQIHASNHGHFVTLKIV